MEKINLPKVSEESIDKFHSKFIIDPLYPGYGPTIGNALRRVMLSSITGSAATSFKVEGISHEFSPIPHAKEDMVELMLNLKEVNFKSFSDEPVILELSKKGPATVTAKDFKANSKVEIANPDAPIITLDKGADFYLEVTVEKGRGFKSVSSEDNKSEIGRIAIDAFFSPVERVSLAIENTRVGQITNYDRINLEVITDGTISPMDAFKEASCVLVDHYQSFVLGESAYSDSDDEETEEIAKESLSSDISEDNDGKIDSKTKIEDLDFSSRTNNALINAGIKTVGGLKRLSPLKLEEVKGLGKKSIDEIKNFLENNE